MTILQAILLGILQGATEFVPVSSSAHLVLVPWLLGWEIPSLAFDTVLHIGTLLAVAGYFFKDWISLLQSALNWVRTRDRSKSGFQLLICIIVGTIPAAILGLLFKDYFESVFQSPVFVAILLIVTAVVLLTAEMLGKPLRELDKLNIRDAIVIGFAQAVAILPGVSRSGSTIGVGMVRGLTRVASARYSFLLSAPIILGAGVVGIKDLIDAGITTATMPVLSAEFIAAFVTGVGVINILMRYLGGNSLRVFAYYCAGFSTVCLIVAFVGLRQV